MEGIETITMSILMLLTSLERIQNAKPTNLDMDHVSTIDIVYCIKFQRYYRESEPLYVLQCNKFIV